MLKYLLVCIILVITSCSPFGGQSLVESIGASIGKLFSGKSTSEVISGSTQVINTNPSVPSQNYKVTVSVGGQMTQDAFETSGGYKVYTSVQGTTTQ